MKPLKKSYIVVVPTVQSRGAPPSSGHFMIKMCSFWQPHYADGHLMIFFLLLSQARAWMEQGRRTVWTEEMGVMGQAVQLFMPLKWQPEGEVLPLG